MNARLTFHSVVLAALGAVLFAGCGAETKPAFPVAVATATVAAHRTGEATPTSAPEETLLGLPVKRLRFAGPAPLPADVALYIESGCFGCDAPPVSLERLYRLGDGAVQTEELFRVPGATATSPAPGGKRITSIAANSGAGDVLVTVCEGPGCSGVGVQQPGSTTSVRHSTDGGVTWKDEQSFDGSAVVVAAAGPAGAALVRRTYFADTGRKVELRYYGSDRARSIELRGKTPEEARFLTPHGGAPLLVDGLKLYQVNIAPTNQPQYDFSALPPGATLQDIQVLPGTLTAVVTFSLGTHVYTAVVESARVGVHTFKEVFAWPAERPHFGGAQASFFGARELVVSVGVGSGNVPAIVNLDTGTISPVEELVSRGTAGDRLLVKAVIAGPLARVKGTGPGDCLNVRRSPEVSDNSYACYADGVLLRYAGQRIRAEGLEWTLLRTPDGRTGWASSEFIEPKGSAPSFELHPAGKRTGNAEVDVIIAALESGPVPQTLIGWTAIACVAPPVTATGGPPECPAGVAKDTLIEVIQGAQCEGYWRIRPAGGEPLRLAAGAADRLYAVVREDGTRADFTLIYANPERVHEGKTVMVKGGKVVADSAGCGHSPADLVEGATGIVLAPR
jgi:hypothetical protein